MGIKKRETEARGWTIEDGGYRKEKKRRERRERG